jgi:regulatory protein
VRELEARLLRKWAGAEKIQVLVDDVISTLQADGALSDARFADSFIRSRRQRFQGPVKIRSELRQRQVPDAVIEAHLHQAEPGWTELVPNGFRTSIRRMAADRASITAGLRRDSPSTGHGRVG